MGRLQQSVTPSALFAVAPLTRGLLAYDFCPLVLSFSFAFPSAADVVICLAVVPKSDYILESVARRVPEVTRRQVGQAVQLDLCTN